MAEETDGGGTAPPRRVLETALYAEDLEAARAFYGGVIGLAAVHFAPERNAFFRCGEGMLLVFDPRATETEPVAVGGGTIPLHGARGPGHVAFAANDDEMAAWRARFARHGVPVESEIDWPGGGHSIYVRDPAGNSVEIASPRLWKLAPA